MQVKSFVRIISIVSIGFLNANANELPESHEKHLPDLLSLADELQDNWEEVQYSQNDPSTWVQMSWITKHRARIIGTILLPGIGTAIGHAVDRHDDRVQTAKNEAKQKDEAKSRQQEAETQAAILRQQAAEKELAYQQELTRIAEERRIEQAAYIAKQAELQAVIDAKTEEIRRLLTKVPPTKALVAKGLADMCMEKITNSNSKQIIEQAFSEFYTLLMAVLNFGD